MLRLVKLLPISVSLLVCLGYYYFMHIWSSGIAIILCIFTVSSQFSKQVRLLNLVVEDFKQLLVQILLTLYKADKI